MITEPDTTIAPSLTSLIEQPFGEFVRAIRKEFGLNQSEAASAFGVSQPTICRWEQGAQEPTLDSLKGCQDLLRRYKAARAGQGVDPGPRHIDPERQKQADRIMEDAGIKSPPRIADLHDDDAAFDDLPAGDPFNLALGVYAEAIAGHRKLMTKVTAEAVALARQGVIEAHLTGARDRAVGLSHAAEAWNLGATNAALKAQISDAEAKSREAEVLRYQPDPLKVPKGQAPCRADDDDANLALVDRLYTCFFTMTIDDASQPGTPERSRFMERLRILDEVMGALKGRAP